MSPKNLILTAILILTTLPSHALIRKVSGIIAHHTTWTCDTFFLTGDVQVAPGAVLTIESPCLVDLSSGHGIIINGTLIARGTMNDPVRFQGDHSLPGSCAGGIKILSNLQSHPSEFIYCSFFQCGSSTIQGSFSGAVDIHDANRLKISYCSFIQNQSPLAGGAVSATNSSMHLTRCIFRENRSGQKAGAVYCNLCSDVMVVGCSFVMNHTHGQGGGIYCKDTDGTLEGNEFLSNTASTIVGAPGNTTGEGGGVYLCSVSGGMSVLSNRFINNNSNASLYESSFQSLIANNLIANNAGMGIVCGHAHSRSIYLNNTIVSNECGGLFCASDQVEVWNNIFWNNAGISPGSQFIPMQSFALIFHNCLPDGYPGPSIASVHDDPRFVLPSTMHGLSAQAEDCDWRLSGFSPCIDAGANNPSSGAPLSSDLAGFPRIQGTAVDQGAYEFPIGTSTSNMQITPFSAFPFPNPCRESIRIEGQESMGAMDLRLYDPYGKEVLQRRVHPHETIHVSHLVAGTYLYRIGAAAGSSCTGKIIKH